MNVAALPHEVTIVGIRRCYIKQKNQKTGINGDTVCDMLLPSDTDLHAEPLRVNH